MGPLDSMVRKNPFFKTFLVEQRICSNQDSDEWGPIWAPKILQLASMTSQLSLGKKLNAYLS